MASCFPTCCWKVSEHVDYGGFFNSEPHGFGLLGLLLWLWVVAIEEGALFGVLVF